MSPAVLALALIAATVSAVPLRPDGPSEDLYSGYLHDSPYEETKQLGRNLDSIGGGNLLRDLESGLLRSRAFTFPRASRQNLDALSGITFGGSKRFDPLSGQTFGSDKRSGGGFDEIDRSGFDSFIKKKNFDEIDRSGFNGFVKRNFDEIDRSGFNGFVKRGAPSHN